MSRPTMPEVDTDRDYTRWAVPYTAPGSKGGALTVLAFDADDALARARAIHARQVTHQAHDRKKHKIRLSNTDLTRITYGTPAQVTR